MLRLERRLLESGAIVVPQSCPASTCTRTLHASTTSAAGAAADPCSAADACADDHAAADDCECSNSDSGGESDGGGAHTLHVFAGLGCITVYEDHYMDDDDVDVEYNDGEAEHEFLEQACGSDFGVVQQQQQQQVRRRGAAGDDAPSMGSLSSDAFQALCRKLSKYELPSLHACTMSQVRTCLGQSMRQRLRLAQTMVFDRLCQRSSCL